MYTSLCQKVNKNWNLLCILKTEISYVTEVNAINVHFEEMKGIEEEIENQKYRINFWRSRAFLAFFNPLKACFKSLGPVCSWWRRSNLGLGLHF